MKNKFVILILFSLPLMISCQKELSRDELKEKLSNDKKMYSYFAALDSMKSVLAYNTTDLRNFDQNYVNARTSKVKNRADFIRIHEEAGAKNYEPYYDAFLRFKLKKGLLLKKYPELSKMSVGDRQLLFDELRKVTFNVDYKKYLNNSLN
jgi:hypothetical protein